MDSVRTSTPRRGKQVTELAAVLICLAWQLAPGPLPSGVATAQPLAADSRFDLRPLAYNHPGLDVDLGVGLWAWPIPWDVDGDGDYDLLVACPDQPSNGVWFFENISGDTGTNPLPVFRPAVKLSPAVHYLMPTYIDGQLRVLSPGVEYPDFAEVGIQRPLKLSVDADFHALVGEQTKGPKIRHRQWSYVDYDGDGRLDLIMGIEDWSDYGWDDAFDEQGQWTAGPLHGFVYWLKNVGSSEQPQYDEPQKIRSATGRIDVYGCPTPQFADFDQDGDLDLICGEFLDGLTYFQNIGSRTEPRYADGVRVLKLDRTPLQMDLQMIVPIVFDWNRDGHPDLIVGDEDGRVAWVQNTGQRDERGVPLFHAPVYFQQQAQDLKCGALATPVGVDWDGDGDWDIVSGNTAGYLEYFENLSGPGCEAPQWAAPVKLQVDGQDFRIMAGVNGSIQGPAEAKWGYTTLTAGDWDGDGQVDLIVNSIWGEVVWLRNLGFATDTQRRIPQLAAPQPVVVNWPKNLAVKPTWTWWVPQPRTLVTQWRTTPVVVDWDRDGLLDVVMLDHEGYLAWYQRQRIDEELVLAPPQRIFYCQNYSATDSRHRVQDSNPGPLRLNQGRAGASGRRKLAVVDWDGDGHWDVLVNSESVHWLRNLGRDGGEVWLEDRGPLSPQNVQGHTTSPSVVDFNADGVPDLILGAENGRIYYHRNPRARQ